MAKKKERMVRIYDSLKNFVGENKVHKAGDVLYVSSKDNGYYNIILTANGRSNFIELMKEAKLEDEYEYVMVRSSSSNKDA